MHIHTLFSLDVIASEDDGYPSAGGVGAPLLKSAPLREEKENRLDGMSAVTKFV
jgi:hypothetical protein